MNSRRFFIALTAASGLVVARGVLADPDQDSAPHEIVQPAETDVDDDSDDSREADVDDDTEDGEDTEDGSD